MKFILIKQDLVKAREEISCTNRPFTCPIAQMFRRTLNKKVVVGTMTVSINDGEKRHPLPTIIQDFIEKYDCELIKIDEFEEIEFELEIT